MATLRIDYPEELLKQTQHSPTSLETLAREALLVRLYDLGELSSGQAAQWLGLTRQQFLDVLGRYNVSLFDETADLAAEARYGRR
jgi:predicted HTH domain antitoxin